MVNVAVGEMTESRHLEEKHGEEVGDDEADLVAVTVVAAVSSLNSQIES